MQTAAEDKRYRFDITLERFLRRHLRGAELSETLAERANALADGLHEAANRPSPLSLSLAAAVLVGGAALLFVFGPMVLDVDGDGEVSFADMHAAIDLAHYGRLEKIPVQIRHSNHVCVWMASYTHERGVGMVMEKPTICKIVSPMP